jgi:hypothetical protein
MHSTPMSYFAWNPRTGAGSTSDVDAVAGGGTGADGGAIGSTAPSSELIATVQFLLLYLS